MKILVLGGTGAMGVHLVDLLSQDSGNRITVTSRSRREGKGNISYVQGNSHDMVFLNTLLKDKYDVVVDFMNYRTEEFRERYQLLLDACGQYVYLSSSRVYADSDAPITEDSPRLLDVTNDAEYLSTDEYALAKARQEDLLRKSRYKNWTIIRPYITYSENRLQLGVQEIGNWLYRALHNRSIVFSKDIAQQQTTLTYGLDVARGITAVVNKEKAKGEIFHITAPESIQWVDVLNIYLDVIEERTGKRPNVITTEHSYKLKFAARQYQVKYDRLYSRRFNNSKIGSFIDINTFQSPHKGLSYCLKKFLTNPAFRAIDFGDEAIFDRITGERTPWKEISSLKQIFKYNLYRHIIK